MKSINFVRDEMVLRIQRGAFGGVGVGVGGRCRLMGSNYSSSDMGYVPSSVLLPVSTKARGALLTELLAHAVSFTDEVPPPPLAASAEEPLKSCRYLKWFEWNQNGMPTLPKSMPWARCSHGITFVNPGRNAHLPPLNSRVTLRQGGEQVQKTISVRAEVIVPQDQTAMRRL